MSFTESSSSTYHEEESIITLQVGEREFTTTNTTLTNESRHFRTLLSDPDSTGLQQEGGTYFIDKDPEVFAHILQYLRTRKLPVFYDGKRDDETLYLALLGQATYFEIERLEDWITERKYRNAVKIKGTANLLEGTQWLDKCDEDSDTDGEVQYFPAWSREMVYLCPRSIFVHKGKQEACGRDCYKAQGDKPDWFEEKVVFTTLRVRKEMFFERQIRLPEQ